MTDPLDEQEDLKQIDANGIIDSDNIDKNLIADNQWIVNKILDYRHLRGNEEYLIQWKNYLELTWEPIENIKSTELIINYWNERKDLESPDSSDDWEELVTRVQEIEITTMGLIVHLIMKDGTLCAVNSELANLKCPQKVLEYYQSIITYDI